MIEVEQDIVINGKEFVIEVPEGKRLKDPFLIPKGAKIAIGKSSASGRDMIYVHKDWQSYIFEDSL